MNACAIVAEWPPEWRGPYQSSTWAVMSCIGVTDAQRSTIRPPLFATARSRGIRRACRYRRSFRPWIAHHHLSRPVARYGPRTRDFDGDPISSFDAFPIRVDDRCFELAAALLDEPSGRQVGFTANQQNPAVTQCAGLLHGGGQHLGSKPLISPRGADAVASMTCDLARIIVCK